MPDMAKQRDLGGMCVVAIVVAYSTLEWVTRLWPKIVAEQ
jgi:hypothetical protein